MKWLEWYFSNILRSYRLDEIYNPAPETVEWKSINDMIKYVALISHSILMHFLYHSDTKYAQWFYSSFLLRSPPQLFHLV